MQSYVLIRHAASSRYKAYNIGLPATGDGRFNVKLYITSTSIVFMKSFLFWNIFYAR